VALLLELLLRGIGLVLHRLEVAHDLGWIERDDRLAGLDVVAVARDLRDLEVPDLADAGRVDVGRVDRLEVAGDLGADHEVILLDVDELEIAGVLRTTAENEQQYERALQEPPPSITVSPSLSPLSTTQRCASHAPSLTSFASTAPRGTSSAAFADGRGSSILTDMPG